METVVRNAMIFWLAMVWLCVGGAHCSVRAEVGDGFVMDHFRCRDCAAVPRATLPEASNTAPAGSDIPAPFTHGGSHG
jgi:hypothetical protein